MIVVIDESAHSASVFCHAAMNIRNRYNDVVQEIQLIYTIMKIRRMMDRENCSHIRHSFSKKQLDELLEEGVIDRTRYDSYLSEKDSLHSRRESVRQMMSDRTYPFSVTKEELISDLDEGIIDEDQFRTFSWYLDQNISDHEYDVISVKLKLSVWGLRLPGRYDTFEHIFDLEDKELRQRAYCIHGTLFEGCGNYKAPETAKKTIVPDDLVDRLGHLLSHLLSDGTLDKDYSTSPFNCGFFDLYTKTSEGKIHTKGTTEFPEFIKLIMFVLGAELDYY